MNQFRPYQRFRNLGVAMPMIFFIASQAFALDGDQTVNLKVIDDWKALFGLPPSWAMIAYAL